MPTEKKAPRTVKAPKADQPETAAKAAKGKKVKKTAHTPATEIYLQVAGQQYDCAAIVEKARADYRATHKVGIHSCKVYIKPEEGAAYYVINKVDGKLEL